MKTNQSLSTRPWAKPLGILAVLLLIALAVLSARPSGPALADGGGGFPTNTPTSTLTLVPTLPINPFQVTSTQSGGIVFPPTNTFTPGPYSSQNQLLPQNTALPGNAALAVPPAAAAAAPAKSSNSSSALYCIILLIAALLIGGVIFILLRRR